MELKERLKQIEKNLQSFTQTALQLRNAMTSEDLKEAWLTAVADRAFIGDDVLPRSAQAYDAQKQRAKAATRGRPCRSAY